jgi:hypothetical protein
MPSRRDRLGNSCSANRSSSGPSRHPPPRCEVDAARFRRRAGWACRPSLRCGVHRDSTCGHRSVRSASRVGGTIARFSRVRCSSRSSVVMRTGRSDQPKWFVLVRRDSVLSYVQAVDPRFESANAHTGRALCENGLPKPFPGTRSHPRLRRQQSHYSNSGQRIDGFGDGTTRDQSREHRRFSFGVKGCPRFGCSGAARCVQYAGHRPNTS